MKVESKVACALLVKFFRKLDYDAPLFGATAYQYRRRWDFLLEKLQIKQLVCVTPGGLRGGAAVYHYKLGRPMQDLLWLMRLRRQTTLEAYLQEVAALNIFAQLPKSVRDSILLSASCFAFLASGVCDFAGFWQTCLCATRPHLPAWTVPVSRGVAILLCCGADGCGESYDALCCRGAPWPWRSLATLWACVGDGKQVAASPVSLLGTELAESAWLAMFMNAMVQKLWPSDLPTWTSLLPLPSWCGHTTLLRSWWLWWDLRRLPWLHLALCCRGTPWPWRSLATFWACVGDGKQVATSPVSLLGTELAESEYIYTYSAHTCPQTTQTQTHTYTHLFCIYMNIYIYKYK